MLEEIEHAKDIASMLEGFSCDAVKNTIRDAKKLGGSERFQRVVEDLNQRFQENRSMPTLEMQAKWAKRFPGEQKKALDKIVASSDLSTIVGRTEKVVKQVYRGMELLKTLSETHPGMLARDLTNQLLEWVRSDIQDLASATALEILAKKLVEIPALGRFIGSGGLGYVIEKLFSFEMLGDDSLPGQTEHFIAQAVEAWRNPSFGPTQIQAGPGTRLPAIVNSAQLSTGSPTIAAPQTQVSTPTCMPIQEEKPQANPLARRLPEDQRTPLVKQGTANLVSVNTASTHEWRAKLSANEAELAYHGEAGSYALSAGVKLDTLSILGAGYQGVKDWRRHPISKTYVELQDAVRSYLQPSEPNQKLVNKVHHAEKAFRSAVNATDFISSPTHPDLHSFKHDRTELAKAICYAIRHPSTASREALMAFITNFKTREVKLLEIYREHKAIELAAHAEALRRTRISLIAEELRTLNEPSSVALIRNGQVATSPSQDHLAQAISPPGGDEAAENEVKPPLNPVTPVTSQAEALQDIAVKPTITQAQAAVRAQKILDHVSVGYRALQAVGRFFNEHQKKAAEQKQQALERQKQQQEKRDQRFLLFASVTASTVNAAGNAAARIVRNNFSQSLSDLTAEERRLRASWQPQARL